MMAVFVATPAGAVADVCVDVETGAGVALGWVDPVPAGLAPVVKLG